MERLKNWWALERTYSWAARKDRIVEKMQMKIAWLLPKSVAKWAFIRVTAHATQGQYGNTIVPELTAMDALSRWGD